MICICQTPKKGIEIDNSKHDSTGFATKMTSISHQPPAGSANALFGKTQFFLRHPVLKTFEVKGVLLSVCICWSVAELA